MMIPKEQYEEMVKTYERMIALLKEENEILKTENTQDNLAIQRDDEFEMFRIFDGRGTKKNG